MSLPPRCVFIHMHRRDTLKMLSENIIYTKREDWPIPRVETQLIVRQTAKKRDGRESPSITKVTWVTKRYCMRQPAHTEQNTRSHAREETSLKESILRRSRTQSKIPAPVNYR